MSVTLPVVAAVPDEWDEVAAAAAGTRLEQVVLASHLLGGNRALANMGGGNTSAKGTTTDHVGREVSAMWVKGSGSDLATMTERDFTPLRLDEILPLFERAEMSDEEMVAYLSRCQLDPAAPRSSIETLLHAFVPADHVHHTHPDAINVLACSVDGERLIEECFGARAAWIDYIRPGFTLAKQVGRAVREDPSLELVVLAKHGLVVWGDTAREGYERTVALCNQAAEFVNANAGESMRFGGPSSKARFDDDARARTLAGILPALRGAVSSEHPKLLITDLSAPVRELADSAQGAEICTVGAACPDHLVHTKRVPMWVPYDPASDSVEVLCDRIGEAASAYRAEYREYFERRRGADDVISDADPHGSHVICTTARLR
jgi:rhamnose utilization protein RhaD (predicted bifunctional aldolase and dehydrogenase)